MRRPGRRLTVAVACADTDTMPGPMSNDATVLRLFIWAVTPLGVLVALGWALWEFAGGRPENGAYAVALAVLTVISGNALRRQAKRVRRTKVPQRSELHQVYAIFGSVAVGFLVLSVLLVTGALHGGALLAIAALATSAVNVYILIRATRILHQQETTERG